MADANGDLRARQRDLVRRGYDSISRAYRDDEGRSNPGKPDERTDHYAGWVDALAQLLTPRARVLDLGCGAGVPATKLLTERTFDVLGLDISAVQIERARELVPGATFDQADMVTWDHEPASFDAVVSFYALIHVPLQDQRNLLPKIRRWLRPAGYLARSLVRSAGRELRSTSERRCSGTMPTARRISPGSPRLGSSLSGIASCPRATSVIRSS
jgi:SAM-dependent methyltransferase